MQDSENNLSIKTLAPKRQPYLCVECKGRVVKRCSHLWDEDLQGFKCQDCWHLQIDGKGHRRQI